jgi:signal transduction histidine kinase
MAYESIRATAKGSMRRSAALPTQAPVLLIASLSGVRARVSATLAQRFVAVAIVPMVTLTAWLAVTSEHLEWPVANALFYGYLTASALGVGLYWWIRRPASGFGRWLVCLGFLIWVSSWQSADAPLAFDLGVLAEGPVFVLTVYLFLAFPMGRVEPHAARWLIGALWVVLVTLFLPAILLRPAISGGGVLTQCVPRCPGNALQLGSDVGLALNLLKAETYAVLAIVAAVFFVYLWRICCASRPQRRALLAVAVTSLLYLPVFFALHFSAWVLKSAPANLDTLLWIVLVARALLPLGFLVALLQAELMAGTALRTLLERLATRPSPHQWRDMIAGALDDPALRLGYHDPASGRFRELDGTELAPAPAGRVRVPVDRDAQPIAEMEIDETLAEDPELVRAAAIATVLAVENGALEGELRTSRTRVMEAGSAERRRIGRDLHDSAQQRLVALRIHLTLAGEQLDRAQDRAALERLDTEVERAIEDLRHVAESTVPAILADGGLAAALDQAASNAPLPVKVDAAGLGRHPAALETTIYFCCLEALQNATKHAGPGTSVAIRIRKLPGTLRFVIEDDGIGFDPRHGGPHGNGLANLTDRVSAVGGSLRIDTGPGRGTRVTGDVPD